MPNSRIVAIIPARGGSKGIPEKNIRRIAGKPLIAYTLEAALNCPFVDACVASTDSDAIAAVCHRYDVKVIRRPEELSLDQTPTAPVVVHVLEQLRKDASHFDQLVLLQPTSPLRNATHVTDSIAQFRATGAQSLISVTDAEHHPHKMFTIDGEHLTPFFSRDALHAPRQLLPRAYRQNGAIYIVWVKAFLESASFFIDPCSPYIMDGRDSVDIDTDIDWRVAEALLWTRPDQLEV